MDEINSIISFIGRTNLFNFAIFLSIIIYLFKKIDVIGKIESLRKDVIENIEQSKTVKSDSETDLKRIEESIAHVGEEIAKIIQKADENAHMVGDKILADAEDAVTGIKDNSQKVIDANYGLVKNDILKRTSNAAVEVAKSHIIKELNNNPELHDKLINESIDAIEGVTL